MHLTESELAALTHKDVAELSERVSTHLESCPDCNARLEALRAEDREVAALLSSLDHAAPRSRGAVLLDDLHARRRRRVGAIAAGLALFAAGAAAALPNSPLHHVLLRALSKTGPTDSSTPDPVSKSVPLKARSGVAFIPGGSLDVRFISPHPGGRLRIRLIDGPRVSATADGDAAFSIHQSQLDVTDHGVPIAFALEIPRAVPAVTVWAGKEIVFEVRAGAVSGSHSMDSTGAYTIDFGSASSGRAPRAR